MRTEVKQQAIYFFLKIRKINFPFNSFLSQSYEKQNLIILDAILMLLDFFFSFSLGTVCCACRMFNILIEVNCIL